ncbi:unnamed protein product [Ixodes pacificus]
MHCVLEGVTKQLLELWLTPSERDCFIGTPSNLSVLDERLKCIKPPQWFTRLPRRLSERMHWKASEWIWWLLHYSVPCLHGMLPQPYLDHLCLLVECIFLLLKDAVTPDDITRACDLATEFVVKMQTLYGQRAMTFNIHQMLHLPKSVQMLGPLWTHSSFVFEGGNGTLVKLVSDGNGVPLQILERYVMCLNAKLLRSTIDISEATVSLQSVQSQKIL